MLQAVSRQRKDNEEALINRLKLWEMGKFDEILSECSSLQENLLKTRKNSKRPPIKNSIKLQFLYSLKTGDIRKAVRAIDPENYGIATWDQSTVDSLRIKFPKNNENILPLNSRELVFSSTKIDSSDIFQIINKGLSTAGGLNQLGFRSFKSLIKLKTLLSS